MISRTYDIIECHRPMISQAISKLLDYGIMYDIIILDL